ncbi:TonB-dependent receptor [Hyphococcus sp. DH-69]|uniref:TonB-dependent receptor n=1 Tax=Hyphococcus formosus TaxID=3143534 RepID=UPI00398BB9A5
MLISTAAAQAQDEEASDVIIVQGIRGALGNALNEKREAPNLVEVIQAEDIGKLPDQNLAEVLENITGVQITRTAGVGTGVQIRGTNSNRTEINGVSTVGSGAGRSGISFEDVSASIISAVEVTKASQAKTIEGSVGGTVNLRTIRPLDLDGVLANIRVQGETSSLSTDGIKPRLSAALGNNWSTGAGEFGAVVSASWARQDVSAFRPRADRDNLISSSSGVPSAQSFDFLPIQFLNQDYDNFEYETLNISGTLEWAPTESLRFYFDTIINDQERREESSRVQASGVSSLRNVAVPDSFETVDFGVLPGENGPQTLGSIEAALTGIIPVDLATDDDDPNLRFSGDTNSRITDSRIFSLGTDFNHGNFSARIEGSISSSDSTTPSINTTLNFINPNVPLDPGGANDNAVPFIYDLSGGALTFAVAQNAPFGPSTEQLLDPANVVLRDVNISRDIAENEELAFRGDFSYDLIDSAVGTFLTSVDAGYRFNKSTALRDQVRSNVGLRNLSDSPSGDLFEDILVPGPDNFGDADGRALFVGDFLLIDPELVANDPDAVFASLNAAIAAHGGSISIDDPTSDQSAFFDIEEKTHALYGQVNFEKSIFRGNAGVRYVKTNVASVGNTITNGVATPTTTEGSYDFILPRFNLVASPLENVQLRFSWGKDIRRPDFDDLSTSFTFSTSPNPPVVLGNPDLVPEQVNSLDVSAEWYFAPRAVISVGYFNKKRTNLHVQQQEDPFEDPVTGYRDLTDPCEGGGIFNPIADPNVFAPSGTPVGVCVPVSTTINDPGETTQKGFEVAMQYDLAAWEDTIGFASGFGILANYTHQEFSGGDTVNNASSRASDVFATFGATDVTFKQPLIDLSEDAYNVTLYYEKYGLSARARYTWRSAFRSTDFGSTSSFPWGFPVVQDARGQLNASINYNVTEHLTIGIEGVNLTKSDIRQYCVNDGALLCFQGLTDRRLTFGGSYTF